jgi:hypothetical protein
MQAEGLDGYMHIMLLGGAIQSQNLNWPTTMAALLNMPRFAEPYMCVRLFYAGWYNNRPSYIQIDHHVTPI